MKQKHIVAIVVIVLIIALTVKPVMSCMSNVFWNVIGNQLDKEEAERIEKGEIVRGKDNILTWGNMYVVGHFPDGNHLSIETKDIDETILKKVVEYEINKGKLYIVSDEGYAVIDEKNLCRVFVTVEEDQFVKGYTEDERGKRSYISRRIECESIEYLLEYNSFSMEEKDMFEKILK